MHSANWAPDGITKILSANSFCVITCPTNAIDITGNLNLSLALKWLGMNTLVASLTHLLD